MVIGTRDMPSFAVIREAMRGNPIAGASGSARRSSAKPRNRPSRPTRDEAALDYQLGLDAEEGRTPHHHIGHFACLREVPFFAWFAKPYNLNTPCLKLNTIADACFAENHGTPFVPSMKDCDRQAVPLILAPVKFSTSNAMICMTNKSELFRLDDTCLWSALIHKQMQRPPMPTPRVKYILSPNEIPAGLNYVLVMYGEKYEQTKHRLGLTITVARQNSKTVSELSFLTAVHTAKRLAKQEGISAVFACK